MILLPVWIELTEHLHQVVIGVVWFCITVFVLLCVCWFREEKIQLPKRIFHAITFLYLSGLLILLSFRPNGSNYGSVNLIPFETIHFYLSGNVGFLIAFYNLSANIGLFIPFGLYYRYIKQPASMKELLIITIFTISTIEGLQFFTKRGSLDIDDLLLNVVGVWIGYLVQPVFQKVLDIK